MTLDIDEYPFVIKDEKSLWTGIKLFDLYKDAMTPWEWHGEIFSFASKNNIICFSSPFDIEAVNFLENLNAPAYKIASFENNDFALIKRVIETKKPILISTGASKLNEISELVSFLKDHHCENFALLKCTSTYPSDPVESNIRTIPHMKSLFDCQVGVSDHTLGIGASIAAVALGATIIEKHFTIDRLEGGVDSQFSLEPNEMSALVSESLRAWQSLGRISYEITESEKKSIQFKRSLYITKDLKAGDYLSKENLKSLRPGFGLEPKYLELFIGKQIKYDIKKGTPLTWDILMTN
jgi:N-acetylneuraminate synthase